MSRVVSRDGSTARGRSGEIFFFLFLDIAEVGNGDQVFPFMPDGGLEW